PRLRSAARLFVPTTASSIRSCSVVTLGIEAIALSWAFLATLPPLLAPTTGGMELPSVLTIPMRSLAPFRVANQYGLFASMTPARYEIEFQGTRDGVHWIAYPFRYKPQDLRTAPPIFAPYQPRFDWNLWFASLAPWQQSPWVALVQMKLLDDDPAVTSLFRSDPFAGAPPVAVRTVLWQYWFTS